MDTNIIQCIYKAISMCAGNNVSIKVEVDPQHPEMLPDCCLLGAECGG